MAQLIEKELSYRIVGALFEVSNELGSGYQEKYYQRAVARALKKRGIRFEEQVKVPLTYQGESIGRYFIDFVIEGKIALEIKVAPRFYPRDTKQLLGYLKSKKIELGLLVAFTKDGIKVKRVIRGRD